MIPDIGEDMVRISAIIGQKYTAEEKCVAVVLKDKKRQGVIAAGDVGFLFEAGCRVVAEALIAMKYNDPGECDQVIIREIENKMKDVKRGPTNGFSGSFN